MRLIQQRGRATKKSRKQKAYSTEWKLEVVKHAKQVSNHSASNKFNIDRRRVIEWVKQENQLKQLKESSADGKRKKKLPGGGRPLNFKDLDTQLAAWIRERRSKKPRISRRVIHMKAQQMVSTEEDGEGFTASRGWLEKFIKRHHFSNRVKTTVCQKPPSHYARKLVDFVVFVSKQRQKHNYQQIFAADETAVWLEDSSGKCIEDKGLKKVF